jgi:hypothetical protein
LDRRRRLLDNAYEAETDRILTGVATKYGARVFAKARIADVLNISSSGISNDEYNYALKAHFDFTVADQDSCAQFAVEFDGRRHAVDPSAIRRDTLKDAICKRIGFPLLRIGEDSFKRIGRFVLLGWLAKVWFLEDGFNKAQEQGQIPFDKVFDYAAIAGFGYRHERQIIDISNRDISEQLRLIKEHPDRIVTTWPYDPFTWPYVYISRSFKQGVCRASFPEEIRGTDPAGYEVAVAILPVTDDRFIVGNARVRLGNFHAVPGPELATELSVIEVAKLLRQYRENTYKGVSASEVESWRQRIDSWHGYR